MAPTDGLVRKMRMGGGSYLSIYVLSPKNKTNRLRTQGFQYILADVGPRKEGITTFGNGSRLDVAGTSSVMGRGVKVGASENSRSQ